MLYTSYLVLMNTLYMVFIGLVLYWLVRGKLVVTWVQELQPADEHVDEHVEQYEEQLTPLERERMHDMQEFDQRIAGLKDELANFTLLPDSASRTSPVVPQESDGVKNLPHNAVYIRPQQHMVEIAD